MHHPARGHPRNLALNQALITVSYIRQTRMSAIEGRTSMRIDVEILARRRSLAANPAHTRNATEG